MKKILIFWVTAILVLGIAGYASAGEYYMYADFTSSDGFLGGYDVDSYGNYLYVNRGDQIDRYTVSTATTPTTDANTHPDNIGLDGILGTADDNIGPMAARTLSYDTTYSVSEIGGQSVSEIYATATGLYFLDDQSDVSFYDFTTTAVSKITAASSVNLSQLARASDGTWWASNESGYIYRYDTPTSSWVHEISHTVSPGGGHLDGLEIANLDLDGNGVGDGEFIYAADMTSDYMQRYALNGTWQEQYTYSDAGQALVLEGMG